MTDQNRTTSLAFVQKAGNGLKWPKPQFFFELGSKQYHVPEKNIHRSPNSRATLPSSVPLPPVQPRRSRWPRSCGCPRTCPSPARALPVGVQRKRPSPSLRLRSTTVAALTQICRGLRTGSPPRRRSSRRGPSYPAPVVLSRARTATSRVHCHVARAHCRVGRAHRHRSEVTGGWFVGGRCHFGGGPRPTTAEISIRGWPRPNKILFGPWVSGRVPTSHDRPCAESYRLCPCSKG